MVQTVANRPVSQEGIFLWGDPQVGDAFISPYIQGSYNQRPSLQALYNCGIERELGLLVRGGIPLHIDLRPEEAYPLSPLLQNPWDLQVGGDVSVYLHGFAIGGHGLCLAELLQAAQLLPPRFFILPVAADRLVVRGQDNLPGLTIQQQRHPLFHLGQNPRRTDDAGDAHGAGQNHTVGGKAPFFQDNPFQLSMSELHHLGGGQVLGHCNNRGGGQCSFFPAGQSLKQPLLNIADIRHTLVEIRIIQCGQLLPVKAGMMRHRILAVDLLLLNRVDNLPHIVLILQQQQLKVQYFCLLRVRILAQAFY